MAPRNARGGSDVVRRCLSLPTSLISLKDFEARNQCYVSILFCDKNGGAQISGKRHPQVSRFCRKSAVSTISQAVFQQLPGMFQPSSNSSYRP